MSKCQAITKKGTKCSYNAKYGSFCGIHSPKPSTSVVATTKEPEMPTYKTIHYDVNEIIKQLGVRDSNILNIIILFLDGKEHIIHKMKNEFRKLYFNSFNGILNSVNRMSLIMDDKKDIHYIKYTLRVKRHIKSPLLGYYNPYFSFLNFEKNNEKFINTIQVPLYKSYIEKCKSLENFKVPLVSFLGNDLFILFHNPKINNNPEIWKSIYPHEHRGFKSDYEFYLYNFLEDDRYDYTLFYFKGGVGLGRNVFGFNTDDISHDATDEVENVYLNKASWNESVLKSYMKFRHPDKTSEYINQQVKSFFE